MTPLLLLTLLGLGAYVAHKIGGTSGTSAAPGASATPGALPPTPPAGQRLVTLDAHLPEADLQRVIHAVLYETDAIALDGLAQTMGAQGWRCAGYELAYRAWELRGASGPPPLRPTTCGEQKQALGVNIPGVTEEIAAEACRMIDPTLDGATCGAVLTALGTEPDPLKLEAFAATLQETHPGAAAALRQKAFLLRGPPATEAPPIDPTQATQATQATQQSNPIQQTLATQASQPANLIPPATLQQHQATLQQQATQAVQAVLAPTAHAGGAVPNLVADGAPGAPFTVTEPSYAPMEPAIAVAASLSPKLEGTTHHSEGASHPGEGPDLAALAEGAVAQAAAAATQGGPPSGAGTFPLGSPVVAGFPVVAHTARERPRGHWFLALRAGDTPWPMTVAKLGAQKKDPASLAELFAMNPHLWTAPRSGVIASFQPGDEVNVPGAWTDALIKKGFKVKKD